MISFTAKWRVTNEICPKMSLHFIPFYDTGYTLPNPDANKHGSGRQRNEMLVEVCSETKLEAEVHAFSLLFFYECFPK